MTLDALWSIAQIAYSVAAGATVGVAWSIFRRAPRRREMWLLIGTVMALALQYTAMAVDALLHATDTATAPFTVWSGLGHSLSIVCWALLVVFLLTVVTRVPAPEHADRRLAYVVLGSTGVGVAVTVALFLRALSRVVADADGASVHTALATLMSDVTPFPMFAIGVSLAWRTVIRRLSTAERTGWVWRLVRASRWPLAPPDHQPLTTEPKTSTDDVKVVLIVMGTASLVAANIHVLRTLVEWTAALVACSVVCQVVLLPSLVGLVYYQERYVFFDLVIKRGVLFVALSVVTTVTCYLFMRAVSIGPPQAAGVSVAATFLIYGATRLTGRAERWLDRLIFHRPNYETELQVVSAAMAQCADTDALSATVTTRLKTILGAEFVRYEVGSRRSNHLAIRVVRPDGHQGVLAFGARPRGQRYGCEDVTFIEAVAAHFAALLAGFAARRAQDAATTAELKALRAQINPHFLFNALNVLAQMARDQPATERTIINLSRVFHHALESTTREAVPLHDEIDAVRAYLEIERERFDDRLHFDIDVSEDLLETRIPPMLLQPLIENALKHGLSTKVAGGYIRVAAERQDGHLRMTVTDDGVGFDPARAAVNVGLANVRTRVEMSGGRWSLESAPGTGTTIRIDIAV